MDNAVNYEILFAFISNLILLGGTLIAVTNWLNSRLNGLNERLAKSSQSNATRDLEITSKVDLLQQKLEFFQEGLTLRANGNRELIEHRTKRFTDELERAKKEVIADLSQLEARIKQVEGFAQKAGFRPRNEKSDED